MSNVTYVGDMVAEAALEIGDQNKIRIQDPDWITIYNKAQREACERWNVLEYEYQQGTQPTDRYAFPDLMKQMRTLRTSYTPDDETTFYDLKEMTDDEFRETTRRRYSVATAPTHYFARRDMFHVWPMPAAAVDNALIIICYSLPSRIVSLSGTLLEVPDICTGLIIERMVIEGFRNTDRYEAAQHRYQAWIADGMKVEEAVEDRTDDRRQSVQPKSMRNPLSGMA